jgi:tetratricopeptide (TPR) repeat protein
MRASAVAAASARWAHPCVMGILVVCAGLATGCVAQRHKPESIADHFIRQGEPTVNFGGPVAKPSTDEYVAQLRKLALEAHPREKSTTGEVAEGRDERLRQALIRLQAGPTAQAHRDVAVEYRRLRIADAAYGHLSTAIRLAPNEAASYDLRARLWRGWKLPQLGLPDARRAVALAPRSASAWNTLGLLLEETGRHAESLKAYLHAVVLEDDAAYAWSNLCRVWIADREGASAIQACRRASSLAPADSKVAANLVVAERLIAPPSRPAPSESVSVDRRHDSTPGVTHRTPPVHY